MNDDLFPPLRRVAKYNQWKGVISLESLDKCYVKWAWSPDGFYPSSAEQSMRLTQLAVDDEEGIGPDPQQRNAMAYLLANEAVVTTSLFQALQADLDVRALELGGTDGWQPTEIAARDRFLESVLNGSGITEIVRLKSAVVYKRQFANYSYIGFIFHRGWDWEHDFIVIMHKDRVVDSGDHGSLCNFEEDDDYENEGEPVYGYYC